jgi:hypothetical protein
MIDEGLRECIDVVDLDGKISNLIGVAHVFPHLQCVGGRLLVVARDDIAIVNIVEVSITIGSAYRSVLVSLRPPIKIAPVTMVPAVT